MPTGGLSRGVTNVRDDDQVSRTAACMIHGMLEEGGLARSPARTENGRPPPSPSLRADGTSDRAGSPALTAAGCDPAGEGLAF